MLILVGDPISVATSGCSGSQFGNFPMSPEVRKCLEEVKRGSPHFSINTLAMRLAAQETKSRFGIIWSHAPMGFIGALWSHAPMGFIGTLWSHAPMGSNDIHQWHIAQCGSSSTVWCVFVLGFRWGGQSAEDHTRHMKSLSYRAIVEVSLQRGKSCVSLCGGSGGL